MADRLDLGGLELRPALGETALALIPFGFCQKKPGRPSASIMFGYGGERQRVPLEPMLRIDTIETASAITLELHGRLIGPWVLLLESLWKSTEDCPAAKNLAVDLTDLTAIDVAGCYLLRLMKARSVTLAGGGIGIRALVGDEQSP